MSKRWKQTWARHVLIDDIPPNIAHYQRPSSCQTASTPRHMGSIFCASEMEDDRLDAKRQKYIISHNALRQMTILRYLVTKAFSILEIHALFLSLAVLKEHLTAAFMYFGIVYAWNVNFHTVVWIHHILPFKMKNKAQMTVTRVKLG